MSVRARQGSVECFFQPGSTFSFEVVISHSLDGGATITVPDGVRVHLTSISVGDEAVDHVVGDVGGCHWAHIALYFSSDENKKVLPLCPFVLSSDDTRITCHPCMTSVDLSLCGPRKFRFAVRNTIRSEFLNEFPRTTSMSLFGSVMSYDLVRHNTTTGQSSHQYQSGSR